MKRADSFEKGVELVAAAVFAAAVGYAVFALSGLPQPEGGMVVAVAFGISFYLCRGALAAFADKDAPFAVPVFDVRGIEIEEDELLLEDRVGTTELLLTLDDQVAADDLLLTQADRVSANAGTLDLDDVLDELGPDSRVVRLFDRKTMPTPGELKARIDDHLQQGTPAPVQSDAAQALSDALAELRRSLRR